MRIAGIEKCSLVDWPGRMAAVVFAPGCNYDCFYCHNRNLLHADAHLDGPSEAAVLAWLTTRRDYLDGVVVSGGEATLQPGLRTFIGRVRDLGFPIKLDTNGSRPTVVSRLIDDGLIDYIAMDLKAPAEQYRWVCGPNADIAAVDESIELLLRDTTDYEFRTTVVPQLTKSDIVAMAKRIQGARRYILQQYRPQKPTHTNDHTIASPLTDPPHPPTWFTTVLNEISDYVHVCETRGVDTAKVTCAA
ncbi:MAG TPA: anaerobic ribonucleoside-triphosphate reductase activating protein [Candidatus Hydrogenedentes bacterium]|nr:anaerobic ribonucleoside-triphosphate reductase activating protein [Candidatus Hydrogenedentota bacterium]HOS01599.1 anaerobic ribonucleoside-triphosphate reductase activating protein [Candidatus Hydrogenedentota bacterium]